ncbi:MAG: hypothetical protein AAF387_10435 [Pseudomonadota bacterium]
MKFSFGLVIFLVTQTVAAQEIISKEVLHQKTIEKAVTFLYEIADDGSIEGELLNATAQRVTDVQVLVRYSWVWARESNKERKNPSWADTFTFPIDLKPGDSSPLSIPALRKIENNDQGKFLISAKVMGYTRFKWVRGD